MVLLLLGGLRCGRLGVLRAGAKVVLRGPRQTQLVRQPQQAQLHGPRQSTCGGIQAWVLVGSRLAFGGGLFEKNNAIVRELPAEPAAPTALPCIVLQECIQHDVCAYVRCSFRLWDGHWEQGWGCFVWLELQTLLALSELCASFPAGVGLFLFAASSIRLLAYGCVASTRVCASSPHVEKKWRFHD